MTKTESAAGLSRCDISFIVLIVVLALASLWSWFDFDRPVFAALNRHPVDWNMHFWVKAFTDFGRVWLPVWILLVWTLFTRRSRPALLVFLALIIMTLFVFPLKFSVKRLRPAAQIETATNTQAEKDLYEEQSFPSGDTASAFTIAAALIALNSWPPIVFLLLVFASVIGALRVIMMAHYPSDVFAGAAIGCLAAWLAVQIDKRLLPLYPPKFVLNRNHVVVAIILVPLICEYFERKPFFAYLAAHTLFAGCALLAAWTLFKIQKKLQKPEHGNDLKNI
jgi:membrane-associated phospholipid phosphatase